MRMARNETINRFRKEKRLQPLSVGLPDPVSSGDTSAAVEMNSREINRIFLEALANPELPEPVGQILRLRFIDDLNVSEIMRVTGKPRSTVYDLMEKGVRHLVATFEAAGVKREDLMS